MKLARNLARYSAALALASAPLAASAATPSWEIDGGHSSAQFSVRHLMISNVRGEFGKMSGTITYDEKDPTQSSVEATIDATTIFTREPKRDEHLKSADFFDVAKFPTLTFKSTKVTAAGPGKLKVAGDLTLHGVTKPVVLDVNGPAPALTDSRGNKKTGASATAKISRKDFGLNWNKALDTGGVVVGDEVAIQIDVELMMKAEAPAATAGTDTGTKAK
jgi:polyisoprenoid-binding protein YceI